MPRHSGRRLSVYDNSDWEPDPELYDLLQQRKAMRPSSSPPDLPLLGPRPVASPPSQPSWSWLPTADELAEVRRITHNGRSLSIRAAQDVAAGAGSIGALPRPPRGPRGKQQPRLQQLQAAASARPALTSSASSTPTNLPASASPIIRHHAASGGGSTMPGPFQTAPPSLPPLPLPAPSTGVLSAAEPLSEEEDDVVVVRPSPAVTPGARARATAATPPPELVPARELAVQPSTVCPAGAGETPPVLAPVRGHANHPSISPPALAGGPPPAAPDMPAELVSAQSAISMGKRA